MPQVDVSQSTSELEMVKRIDVSTVKITSTTSKNTPGIKKIPKKKLKGMPWSEGYGDYWTSRRNTQKALVPLMFIAQCFGIFPVSGKLQDDYRHLSFSAWSLNSVYSIIVIIAALYLSLKTFAEAWYATDGDFNLARQFAFNFVSTSYLICYYRLAGRWKNIMKIWSGFDQKMAHFYRVEFTKRVALFTAVYSLTSISEHLLSYTYALDDSCLFTWGKFLIRTSHNEKAGFEYYKAWATYLQKPHQIINIFLTVSWNFTDVFISSISIALSSKFEQFNLELAHSSKNKGHSVAYWKLMRETYNQLALFTKFLDKNLSMFVILSFFNNLFFVCFQLLNTLGYLTFWRKIYFVVSFAHILFRTCSVCLCAASIYENSKKPIKMLFMVPSETYNVEVHRLLLQVLLDRQTLSGFNFFYITKGLLLTVAGTILTYEIFLVQLDNLKEDGPEDNYIEGC